jgi:hypothetical protein
VSYWSEDNGISRYSYDREKLTPKQPVILSQENVETVWKVAAVVAILFAGVAGIGAFGGILAGGLRGVA